MHSWRDIWTTTAKHVLQVSPKEFARAAESDEFAGRLRRFIGPDSAVMRSPYPIGRFFVEVNRSGESLVSLAERLIAFALPGKSFSFTTLDELGK